MTTSLNNPVMLSLTHSAATTEGTEQIRSGACGESLSSLYLSRAQCHVERTEKEGNGSISKEAQIFKGTERGRPLCSPTAIRLVY